MQYRQGTKDYKLTYKHSNNLEVIRYSDSDFARCADTRKSTSGYIFAPTRGAISWKSGKQTIIASSTMKVEFIRCYEATTQALWLRNFITNLKIVDFIKSLMEIYCDNSAVVFFSKNNKKGSHNKYIDIKFLVVKDHIRSMNNY